MASQNSLQAKDQIMEMTYKQMLAFVDEHFGSYATVDWDNEHDCWSIRTDVVAPFEMNDYVGTPFYRDFVANGRIKRHEFERWAQKNAVSGPMSTQVEEYNELTNLAGDRYVARILVYRSALGEAKTRELITNFDEAMDWAEERNLDLTKAREMADYIGGGTMADFEKRLIDNQVEEMEEFFNA